MKLIQNVRERWRVFTDTLTRFPLSVVTLVAATITGMLSIEAGNHREVLYRLLVTFLLGALLAAVLQFAYERFGVRPLHRIISMGLAVVLTVFYYILIGSVTWQEEDITRTSVLFFILIVSFLWIPIIRSPYHFNHSFMAAFKGFFLSLLFTGVLFLGIALVLGATDMLLFDIDGKTYSHAANLIFILIAPIYFLSMIPHYPGREGVENSEEEITLQRLTSPTKFLETLFSYVIIPITAVFTVVLLLYIVTNITGEFWSDNLMEPLLITYSITVICIYLLTSSINNKIVRYFRLIFPKALVLVVLFQTIASFLKFKEIGMTYGRYYVLLYGVFALIAGLWFCFKPVDKSGFIAPVLIVMSLISIIPPVDAFTVSKVNQATRLKRLLLENGMFEGDTILAKKDVSQEDREAIVAAVQYLNRMGYTEDIPYLQQYAKGRDFEATFGFEEYESTHDTSKNLYLRRDTTEPISIEGYDRLQRAYIYNEVDPMDLGSFEVDGRTYTLSMMGVKDGNKVYLVLKEQDEILRMELDRIYEKFEEKVNVYDGVITNEEATFTEENSDAKITIVTDNISIYAWDDTKSREMEIYILIKIK